MPSLQPQDDIPDPFDHNEIPECERDLNEEDETWEDADEMLELLEVPEEPVKPEQESKEDQEVEITQEKPAEPENKNMEVDEEPKERKARVIINQRKNSENTVIEDNLLSVFAGSMAPVLK